MAVDLVTYANILVLVIVILLSSLISLRLGLAVSIIELVIGAIFGNFGFLHATDWMTLIATFGGILSTFMAGTEIDVNLMREKYKESFLIGFFSFLAPFIGAFLFTYFIAGWTMQSSLIAGIALSSTSFAVIYSVLIESDLPDVNLAKTLLAATFVTNMTTIIMLSIIFIKPDLYTILFLIISIIVIVLAAKYSEHIFNHDKLKNKVIEPEIKYVFLLLVIFMYFAALGNGEAVLPAFILGLLMSKQLAKVKNLMIRMRTVSYAVITPIFFIVGGLRISFELILTSLGLFIILLGIKIFSKFIGVYFLTNKYISNGNMYFTLLMSTGLTFGTITSLFGLNAGYINQVQYSVLIGVVVSSAIIPTFVAQKWFLPQHSEDMIE
ncbi:cation:proton antiporter [Methanobacterium spitsbergense]|uniref:Cation:proton antiporter n=1 Tax=Methanobacterium spitsbergense TaxID=2874285 RepID=A0A8T5UV46_9EURY|nr:cation:proton antiporter [Methanobacterium spitsbergense]MBZ2164529.1 cation:proton antiporter [Methanobacterium spitsbergense]